MRHTRRNKKIRLRFPALDSRESYPMLGIGATLAGTGLALMFLPDDPQPKGALVTSGVWMALGLLAAPVYAARRDARRLLRAEHVLTLAPIYWLLLDLLQGAYDMTSCTHEDVTRSFIAIAVFSIS